MGIELARSVRAFERGEKRSTVGFFLPLLCPPSETRSGSDFRASPRSCIFCPYLGKENVSSSGLIFYQEIPTFEGRSRRPYSRAFRLLRTETLPT